MMLKSELNLSGTNAVIKNSEGDIVANAYRRDNAYHFVTVGGTELHTMEISTVIYDKSGVKLNNVFGVFLSEGLSKYRQYMRELQNPVSTAQSVAGELVGA